LEANNNQNTTTMELIIIIKIKTVYGEDKIYPACATAETFAALTGKKTFSPVDLKHIRALGYTIKQGFFSGDTMTAAVDFN